MEKYISPITTTRHILLPCIMFLSYMDLCGMFTKRPVLPSRFNRPPLTKEQRNVLAEAEEGRLRGQKEYIRIRKEGEIALASEKANQVKIQGSDGKTIIPFKIAKMSKILATMLNGLGGIPEDPLPLTQYSISVINDIRNIINQRFLFPDRIKKQIEQYSFPQLVERFNFAHYLEFPSSIENIFQPKIISMAKNMNFQEIKKNQNAIESLSPEIPEIKSLLVRARTPYITIINKQGQSLYVPENIYKQSKYLSVSLKFQEHRNDRAMSFNDFPITLLDQLFDIIENKDKISIDKKIENYSLKDLIENINCLEFLGFSHEIQKPFYKKIYVSCRQESWQHIEEQLAFLNPHLVANIFLNPVIDKLKFSLLKKSLDQNDRKIKLPISGLHGAFSSDNKILVTDSSKHFNVYGIDDKSIIFSKQYPVVGEILSMAISANNKKLAFCTTADTNNVLLYDLDDKEGVIPETRQILIGHEINLYQSNLNYLANIAFSPNDKLLISANNLASSKDRLLSWGFNENGIIDKKPHVLIGNVQHIISPIKFNDNKTLSIVSTWEIEKINNLTIWTFNENGTINSRRLIGNKQRIHDWVYDPIAFFSYDKKFIAKASRKERNENDSLYMYDFNDTNNITAQSIFSHNGYIQLIGIILNDRIVVGKIYDPERLVFIDINDINKPLVEIMPAEDYGHLYFSRDEKKCFATSQKNGFICTLLTHEEEKVLHDSLKNLDANQLLLIDKTLSSATDLPDFNDYKIPQKIIDLLKQLKHNEFIERLKKYGYI